MSPRDATGTRRALLDATRELLEEPGAANVGLERIASRAGYSRQGIYRHFGSRAGLLKAVLADIDERAGAAASIERILAGRDATAMLDALISWWADYVSGFSRVARSVYAGRGGVPTAAPARGGGGRGH